MRGRGKGPARAVSALVVVVLIATGCGSREEDEAPLVSLEPSGVRVVPEETASAPAGTDDLCGLADPVVLSDVSRWAPYVPALEEALPPEVDVAAFVDLVEADTIAVPSVVTTMDRVWDVVDERCEQDPLIPVCHAMLAIALADPVGWTVLTEEPAEIEAAYLLAIDNWTDLEAADPSLAAAAEAHLRFLRPASERLAEVGWGPGKIGVLEPLEEELVALGTPEIVAALQTTEERCGMG